MDLHRRTLLAHRLRIALTVEDAKEILGFPPHYNPTDTEINKAWRAKSIEHHPDRGGDHRKMVEVNVAKEVLEGKRTNDRTERVGDPEEKKRAEELRANIAIIQREMSACTRIFERAMGEVEGTFTPSWRLDAHEFLTHTFAHSVDTLHKTAEHVTQTSEKPSDKTVAKKVEAFCTVLSSMALRLGARVNGLKKAIEVASAHSSIESIKAVHVAAHDYTAMFIKLYAESAKLMTLLYTNEGMAIPFDIAEQYSDAHQQVISFKDFYTPFKGKVEAEAVAQIDRSVKTVRALLDQYGVGHGFPNENAWKVPDDFQQAIEALGKASTRPKNATIAHRVVSRYINRV
jgi:hypothetical protein